MEKKKTVRRIKTERTKLREPLKSNTKSGAKMQQPTTIEQDECIFVPGSASYTIKISKVKKAQKKPKLSQGEKCQKRSFVLECTDNAGYTALHKG